MSGSVPVVIPVIPLHAQPSLPSAADAARTRAALAQAEVRDQWQRPWRDLRISVTDRCNFRCTYCMPKSVFGRDYAFLPHEALLSFEEIVRFARVAVRLGVEKIRLTGGEPTLRRDLPRLVELLAGLRTPSGAALDLSLTTNGSSLRRWARPLRAAGLQRVTVSLDALDEATFRAMNDVDFPAARVLDGIAAAVEAGLSPVKVNAVVRRGVNDGEIVRLARHFKGSGVTVRFIEYMDVGSSNGWRLDEVVPSAEVVRRIDAFSALEPIGRQRPNEVAERWRYRDGGGEIGVISSVTQAFCGACSRARLSTDGRVYSCLFASQGVDVRALLRGGASDEALAAQLVGLWQGRSDRYSALRGAATQPALGEKVEMSFIGG